MSRIHGRRSRRIAVGGHSWLRAGRPRVRASGRVTSRPTLYPRPARGPPAVSAVAARSRGEAVGVGRSRRGRQVGGGERRELRGSGRRGVGSVRLRRGAAARRPSARSWAGSSPTGSGRRRATWTSLAVEIAEHRPRVPDELAAGAVVARRGRAWRRPSARVRLISGISGIVPAGTPVTVGGMVVCWMPSEPAVLVGAVDPDPRLDDPLRLLGLLPRAGPLA